MLLAGVRLYAIQQSYSAGLNHRWSLADVQTQGMSCSLLLVHQIMDPVLLGCMLEGMGPPSRDKYRSWRGEELTAPGI